VDLQSIELIKIEPSELDDFLSLGWFRMQQTIFTTDKLHFNGTTFSTIWLRTRLVNFEPDKKYRLLSNKNRQFEIQIEKATITAQHEALYASYKEHISFETAPSLYWLLYGNSIHDVYNTYVINVYDRNKMIGAGFFDLGNTSAAGISSIYDPAYKKYSLGKYMIYEKMFHCKRQNFEYFYPGYFVPGYAMFDYKLEIGTPSIEYFDPHKKAWQSLSPIKFPA
jgi:arginine-tRNA-protein transferase